jgi:catechol 2,3-dioxygenase-like lactoylglutathione lyase family enzyme
MIRSLAHACFVVADLDRAVRFYCDGLGMKVAFDFKNEQGKRRGVYLSCGGRTFVEMFVGQPIPADPNAKNSYRHISLEVDNIESLRTTLAAVGAQLSERKMGGDNSWQAWTADPDGNAIELHEYTPESMQVKAIEALTKGTCCG